jgi:hypothetical protein
MGQRRLRYWQAFMSVKDTEYPYIVQRTLTVARHVVQIRLSILLTTLIIFLIVLAAVVWPRLGQPRDSQGRPVQLPYSQMDWIIQAVEQRHRGAGPVVLLPNAAFVMDNKNLAYGVTFTPDDRLDAHIVLPGDLAGPHARNDV